MMTKDWVQGVGLSPVCQILWQIVVRVVITSSLPAWTSSAGMLLTPADFPFFNDWTAVSASLWRMEWSSSVCSGTVQYWRISVDIVILQLRTVFCPSVQYLSFFCEAFSWKIVDTQWSSLSRVSRPSYCCSSSDFLLSLYTVLISSFLMPFSCTS